MLPRLNDMMTAIVKEAINGLPPVKPVGDSDDESSSSDDDDEAGMEKKDNMAKEVDLEKEKDIKAASRYMELVEQRCQADTIEKCVSKLVQRYQKSGICSEGDEKISNDIDANITEIMIWAENKCKWTKGHDWSPLLANAGCTVIAAKWNLSNIMHRQSLIPMNITCKEAITKAKSQITEVYNILWKVQMRSRQIREMFLEDRAEHLAETQDMTKANALQQLLMAERSFLIFRQLGI
jgi:hypothetical protein